MNNCICCGDRLLRHINGRRVSWFCPTCYQKVPNIEELILNRDRKKIAFKWRTNSLVNAIEKVENFTHSTN